MHEDEGGAKGQGQGQDKGYERLSKLNQVYLAIISRYKDYIEDKESLSLAELPMLVTPKDNLVLKIAGEIKGSFSPYVYEKDFYEASMKAFAFVKEKVDTVVLPLQFWLMPEDVLTFMIGDNMDKNILLCSIFIALGNPSAKVLAVVKDSAQKVLVYYELNGMIRAFSIDGEPIELASLDEVKKKLGVDDGATAYEFNDKMYIDIS
jgi:hypothetical protein